MTGDGRRRGAAGTGERAPLAHLAELIRGAGSVVALTGAGVSVPSGIPDFRSPGTGLWEHVNPMEVAHIDVFNDDPERFWGFYAERFAALEDKRPNDVHRALVTLEAEGLLDAVITQNVDMLHRRAGTRELVEVHGSIARCICLACGARVTLAEARRELAADERGVPRCERCAVAAEAGRRPVRRDAACRRRSSAPRSCAPRPICCCASAPRSRSTRSPACRCSPSERAVRSRSSRAVRRRSMSSRVCAWTGISWRRCGGCWTPSAWPTGPLECFKSRGGGISREKMHGETSAFDAISGRLNHLSQARRSRDRRAEALARPVAAGHADLRADEVLPGDVIRMAGNVWVIQDARLGSGGVCFLSTLGGHMYACDRSQQVQLLSLPRKSPSGHGAAPKLRRRVPATQRTVAA